MVLETTFSSYTLLNQLGQGGVGRVFAAVDEAGREWAVKVLNPDAANAERRKRFKNEILFAQRNTHPHLISVADHGNYSSPKGSVPFYVMPKLAGSLRSLMPTIATNAARLRYFDQILSGIQAAHLLGVVHRDLKPENILHDPGQDALLVADFGIASFTDEELYTIVETGSQARLANFQYAAPEQRLRGSAVGRPADIYALGLILNEMFTGTLPHGTDYQLIGSVAQEYSWLDPLVDGMLKQNPAKRVGDIETLKQSLIAQKQEFVVRQRLSEISKTVVPTSTVEEPLAETPPRIIDFKWQNGTLILIFDQQLPEKWVSSLRNMGSYTSVYGKGPETFRFMDNRAIVDVADTEVQRVIDAFKGWLPQVTATYRSLLSRERRQQEDRQRAALRAEQEELERQQRLRSSVRL